MIYNHDMNIMRILSTGLLTLLLIPATFADEVTDTTEAYKIACMNALHISEKLSAVGTYRTRIQDCVDDRIQAELNEDRRLRLQVRTEAVQQRILDDSSTYIHRAIPEVQVQSNRFDDAQEGFRKLETNKPSTRHSTYPLIVSPSTGYERYVPQTSNPINLRTTSEERLSRRLIKQNARDQSSTSSRNAAAELYEEALRKALEECSDIQSNFHRTNCIRSAMRKAGTR